MSIVGPPDHRGHLPGGRSRNMRTLIIAGVILILIWTIKKSPLFQAQVSFAGAPPPPIPYRRFLSPPLSFPYHLLMP